VIEIAASTAKPHTEVIMSKKSVMVRIGALALLLALVVAEPALAATAQDPGKNLGTMLQTWAQYLLPGVVALVAIPAIARHDIGQGITIIILAMLLGGFAFASNAEVGNFVTSVWRTLAGS
jgi:hypothetical protein